MSVPIRTKTGDWIAEAVSALQKAEIMLEATADEIDRQSHPLAERPKEALRRIADELRSEARALRQAELPF